MSTPDLEEASVFKKVTTTGFRDITNKDYVTTASAALDGVGMVEKFAPKVGKIIPYSSSIGAVLSGAEAYYNEDITRVRISKYFNGASIKQLVRHNPALRNRLENGGVDWGNMAGSMASSAAGAAVGAAGAGALISAIPLLLPIMPIAFPIAMLVGSGFGGYVANKLYSDTFVKQQQDPIIINMQIAKMNSVGEAIPSEVVFAALAANLKGRAGEYAEARLAKYTGTKLFMEALSDPSNMSKLTAMMNNTRIDDAIRAQTGMPRDAQNPFKTVAEQYADMINSGQMKPQNLLNPGEGLYIKSQTMMGNAYNIDVPVTPETRQRESSVTI